MANTQNLLRQRFHEATAEREAILLRSAPLRAQRDALVAKVQALEVQMREITKQIKEVEQPLFDLDNERGALNRALNGKTGESG